jgi:hypothetical protein
VSPSPTEPAASPGRLLAWLRLRDRPVHHGIHCGWADDRLRDGADPGGAVVDGYRLAFLIGAGLLLAAALVCGAWLRNRDIPRAAPAGTAAH